MGGTNLSPNPKFEVNYLEYQAFLAEKGKDGSAKGRELPPPPSSI